MEALKDLLSDCSDSGSEDDAVSPQRQHVSGPSEGLDNPKSHKDFYKNGQLPGPLGDFSDLKSLADLGDLKLGDLKAAFGTGAWRRESDSNSVQHVDGGHVDEGMEEDSENVDRGNHSKPASRDVFHGEKHYYSSSDVAVGNPKVEMDMNVAKVAERTCRVGDTAHASPSAESTVAGEASPHSLGDGTGQSPLSTPRSLTHAIISQYPSPENELNSRSAFVCGSLSCSPGKSCVQEQRYPVEDARSGSPGYSRQNERYQCKDDSLELSDSQFKDMDLQVKDAQEKHESLPAEEVERRGSDSSLSSGLPDARSSVQKNTAPWEDIPIRGASNANKDAFKDQILDEFPEKSSASGSATATSSTGPVKRPFLKRGSRMPRSVLPQAGAVAPAAVKPITKNLRLTPGDQEASTARPARSGSAGPRTGGDDTAKEVTVATNRSGSAGPPGRTRAVGKALTLKPAPKREAVKQAADADDLSKFGLDEFEAEVSSYAAAATASKPVTAAASKPVMASSRGLGSVRGPAQNLLAWEDELGSAGEEDDSLTDEYNHTLNGDFRTRSVLEDMYFLPPSQQNSGQQVPRIEGEPPTSKLMMSYFADKGATSSKIQGRSTLSGSSAAAKAAPPVVPAARHPHWEGGEAYESLYGTPKPGPAHHEEELEACEEVDTSHRSDMQKEMQSRLAELDEQIRHFKKERQACQKLQAQAEEAERDVEKEREKLRRETELERQALRAECDAERAAMRKERRRLDTDCERHRQNLASHREQLEDHGRLKQRVEQLQEELKEKEKRWQRTVERLQRQVDDSTRRNQELQEEVRRASQQGLFSVLQENKEPQNSKSAFGRSASTGAVRGRNKISSGSRVADKSVERQGPKDAASSSFAPPSRAGLASVVNPSNKISTATSTTYARGGSQGQAAASATYAREGTQEQSQGATASMRFAPEEFKVPQEDFSGASAHGAAGRNHSIVDQAPMQTTHSAQVASSLAPGESGIPGRRCRQVEQGVAEEVAAQVQSSADSKDSVVVKESQAADGRIDRMYDDGRREIEFPNGLRKVMWRDGRTSVLFQNGDHKEILADGTVIYHYHSTKATQTTFADGTELYRFANGQLERHFPDGVKEIEFANGTSKKIYLDGSEEVRFTDGTVKRTPPRVAASKPTEPQM